ncbi:MAG: response regulator transcription factor [Bacteroidia bacterium]|nr:response regulator transcription factor [Bacteroidota bacterium]MBP9082380.1 response regulator transcription factor [Bacteroidia bacterium]
MKTQKLRIIIFDDNKNVRESVKLLLSTTETMEIVDSFENYDNLLKDIASAKPDVVIMDIDMPGVNGIEGVTKLRVKYPELPVLMLTGFEDDEKVFNSICAGANGYVLKNASMESLISQIEEVHQGGAPMTPVIARKVLNKFSKIHPPSKPASEDDVLQLSSREYDVLNLLVKGKSYKMIASELNVSYETVHSHIKKLYQKLQVNSVGEAVSKTLTKNILGKIMVLLSLFYWH